MSLRDDGKYHCDRCGVTLLNESVHFAVVANDKDGFTPLQYHWCRANACNAAVLAGDTGDVPPLADWLAYQLALAGG